MTAVHTGVLERQWGVEPQQEARIFMKKEELPEDRLAPDRLPDLAKGAGLNLCPIPSAFGNAVMMVS